MLTPVVQRWRARRDTYRPTGEVIRIADYEVAPLAADREAKAFVLAHHYSGSYPAARARFALHRAGEMVGAAIFSVPVQPLALTRVFGDAPAIELGRLVLLDDVPANGESWFLARAFELLARDGYEGVLSFSDPISRTNESGCRVFPGHIGTIYQASNASYLGRSKRELRRVLPDGTLLHGRGLAKIRRRDRGWRYAAALLEKYGAEPLSAHEDSVAWVSRWVPRLTRPLVHHGNHRYAFGLVRCTKQMLSRGQSLPYPKFTQEAA